MKTRLILASLFAVAGLAAAANADIVVTPANDADGNSTGSSSSAPGFGSGSVQANATTPGSKSEIYVSASSLFGHSFTVGDIASMSYWTNKAGDSTSVDWTLLLYTAHKGDGSDSGSFYGSRLNAEPYFTQTPSADDPANTWHQWSTGGANPLRFYDQPRSGTFGTYTDPTLADLTSGSVTWGNGTSHDYTSEVVNLISFQTGSAWANGFQGLIDGFTITLTDGETARINFEATAVPLPSAALAGAATLGLLGVARSRRRR